MKQKLYNVNQAHQVWGTLWGQIKIAMNKGIELEIEVTRAEKSRNQEEMYHSIIGQIAKQAKAHGATWGLHEWKRYLTQEWCHETGREYVKMLRDGQKMVLDIQRTSSFKKPEASEFTEFLIAWAAQNGVTLNEVS